MEGSEGLDIPLIRLRPLRERKVSKREFNRILGSIKAVGLIEPLVVYPEGDDYVILDGVQRYRALLELGVEVAPCILGRQREAFTGNRMVNRVSPVQEHRMIEKSLEEVDEASIAAALGITTIGHRLKKTLLKRLHPDVAAAFDQGKINRVCAREFTHVRPARQKEILDAMAGYKDYSTAFVRTLVVKTPPHQRDTGRRKTQPLGQVRAAKERPPQATGGRRAEARLLLAPVQAVHHRSAPHGDLRANAHQQHPGPGVPPGETPLGGGAVRGDHRGSEGLMTWASRSGPGRRLSAAFWTWTRRGIP